MVFFGEARREPVYGEGLDSRPPMHRPEGVSVSPRPSDAERLLMLEWLGGKHVPSFGEEFGLGLTQIRPATIGLRVIRQAIINRRRLEAQIR